MGESIRVTRRTFVKGAAAAAGLTAAGIFPFKHLRPAFAFGEHPQEQLPFKVTKRVPQVCARACEADCAYYVVVGVDPATGRS